MAFWLRHGQGLVGVDDGLIRRDDFAGLVQASELVSATYEQCGCLLAQARGEASALVDDARAQADQLLAQARRELEQAREEGLAQGLRQAAGQWTARMFESAHDRRDDLQRMSGQWADLVCSAVERIVHETDREALFQRSLRAVTRAIRETPLLTLRVHENDRDAARRAVDAVRTDSGMSCEVEIVADSTLAPASCRFEFEDGTAEACLGHMLDGLRDAVRAAARQIADTATPREEDDLREPKETESFEQEAP